MALDLQLFTVLNNFAGTSGVFDAGIVFFAEYVAYITIAGFLLILFFAPYEMRAKVRMFSAVILSAIIARAGITELIRFLYHRPRPFVAYPVHNLITETSYSFPSGHATFFFAFAMVIYLYNKKWGIGFFAISTLMTISRVMAGVHYPSDIVGGALIGMGVGYVTYYVIEIYGENSKNGMLEKNKQGITEDKDTGKVAK